MTRMDSIEEAQERSYRGHTAIIKIHTTVMIILTSWVSKF